MSKIIIIVLGLLGLSLLVLLHELGHFIAAKLLKIPVEIFSIGFGKPLLKKKIGETEYRLSPFLFGGFIKMEGDEPGKPSENGFNSRPIWHRATVAIAGPAVNLITAFLFLMIMFLTGTRYNAFKDSTKVGFVEEGSPSYGYILQNDSIVSINGKEINNWDQVDLSLRDYSTEHKVEFIRAGERKDVTFTVPVPSSDSLEYFQHGLDYFWPAVIGEVVVDGAAEKAGLLANDTIVEISGKAVTTWYEVPVLVNEFNSSETETTSQLELIDPATRDSNDRDIDWESGEEVANLLANDINDALFDGAYIVHHPEKDDDTTVEKDSVLTFVVLREGGADTISVTPIYNSELDRYLIGIGARQEQYLRKYSFSESISLSGERFMEYSIMIFGVLKKLASGDVPPGHLSGSLTIIFLLGSAAQAGAAYFLDFLAMISINLGILNLMPLVITDGGILLFLAIEFIIRKPVPEKMQQWLSSVFIVLFLTLFVVISFNDVKHIQHYFFGG